MFISILLQTFLLCKINSLLTIATRQLLLDIQSTPGQTICGQCILILHIMLKLSEIQCFLINNSTKAIVTQSLFDNSKCEIDIYLKILRFIATIRPFAESRNGAIELNIHTDVHM